MKYPCRHCECANKHYCTDCQMLKEYKIYQQGRNDAELDCISIMVNWSPMLGVVLKKELERLNKKESEETE